MDKTQMNENERKLKFLESAEKYKNMIKEQQPDVFEFRTSSKSELKKDSVLFAQHCIKGLKERQETALENMVKKYLKDGLSESEIRQMPDVKALEELLKMDELEYLEFLIKEMEEKAKLQETEAQPNNE